MPNNAFTRLQPIGTEAEASQAISGADGSGFEPVAGIGSG